jgi:anthranilate phosphoribosyltransferase
LHGIDAGILEQQYIIRSYTNKGKNARLAKGAHLFRSSEIAVGSAKVADMSNRTWFNDALRALLARRELTAQETRAALTALVDGSAGEAEAAAFLIALRMKGETSSELATAAHVLREYMVRWDPGPGPVLDTCGTGGDGAGTFNISTATAFVVAAAGVTVVKHGNRSVSSRCGSADVLALCGVSMEGDAVSARAALERCGLAFCFAPNFHPALKRVADLRRRLGVGTLFNWLGPLLNPAGATHQLLGVGRLDLLDLMAGAVAQLGTRRTLVISSRDGLDEVSLSAPTLVRDVCGARVTALEWAPDDFGLEPCRLEDLQVDSPEQSAALLRQVLGGAAGPATRVVLANAAAALLAAERATTLPEGVAIASEALLSGRAEKILHALATAKSS